MLSAYRGKACPRPPVAPEFWYYYPAKVLGVDMIEFERHTPFHLALKTVFERFECEGWGIAFCGAPPVEAEHKSEEKWVDNDTLEVRHTARTPCGTLSSAQRFNRFEPSWAVERQIKDLARDLPAWEHLAFAAPENMDVSGMTRAWTEVGESYLLEAWLGVPFFDFFAGARQGGLETAVIDFLENEPLMERLQARYMDQITRKARRICAATPFESLAIGCAWSCNSLIGPRMWRQWDKPVIKAACDEIHRHGRLLHVHFHGKSMETAADFAEMGIDCVCPFERPPGGDVDGIEGLRKLAQILAGRTTMNGNVHTVETLIRGKPADVRREVREILDAFAGNPRVIVGTGDQVGRETPEENIRAMIEEAKSGFKFQHD